MATRRTLFLVSGPFWSDVVCYETKIPGRFFVPKGWRGQEFFSLGVDAFESQARARQTAERHASTLGREGMDALWQAEKARIG